MADEYTVEAALAELRKMFPDDCGYIDQSVSASFGKHGQQVQPHTEIQIDRRDGEILYCDTAPTLDEAMTQVKKWRESQSLRRQN